MAPVQQSWMISSGGGNKGGVHKGEVYMSGVALPLKSVDDEREEGYDYVGKHAGGVGCGHGHAGMAFGVGVSRFT